MDNVARIERDGKAAAASDSITPVELYYLFIPRVCELETLGRILELPYLAK